MTHSFYMAVLLVGLCAAGCYEDVDLNKLGCPDKFTGENCDQCANPKFTGKNCYECADPKYTGENCDQCSNSKMLLPECTGCKPQFTGVNCDQCADPTKFTGENCDQCTDAKFTGPNCNQCANPRFAGQDCDECAPKFSGPNCEQCTDPKFTGPGCDECADSNYAGADCDECADAKFTGPNCDQCAQPNYGGENCDICIPGCSGKTCGDDGCGGNCGTCGCGFECLQSNCVQTACSGKQCGSDGCGGTCGDGCLGNQICESGKCINMGGSDCSSTNDQAIFSAHGVATILNETFDCISACPFMAPAVNCIAECISNPGDSLKPKFALSKTCRDCHGQLAVCISNSCELWGVGCFKNKWTGECDYCLSDFPSCPNNYKTCSGVDISTIKNAL